MSKVCRHCSVAKNKLGDSSAEFSIWHEGHKSECDINHLGSSTSMEIEAEFTLWKRPTSLGFRYITVLSDGDCGKAHGSLKEATVKKLTTYYRKAILRNKGVVNVMKTAIYTTLLHSISTDAKPQHSKCPVGENSWCFDQSAIVNGEKPGNHKLNKDGCGTQNANESLHSMIWAKCPKEIFVNKRRVKWAVTEAVCEYNKGLRTIVETQKALGVATGGSTKQLATILDCQKQQFIENVIKIEKAVHRKYTVAHLPLRAKHLLNAIKKTSVDAAVTSLKWTALYTAQPRASTTEFVYLVPITAARSSFLGIVAPLKGATRDFVARRKTSIRSFFSSLRNVTAAYASLLPSANVGTAQLLEASCDI
ncbi:uncharacterized protein TNCV_1773461 [Trichonephila clavipes]|nr:uncharacterized protein TNCV_1773461 [Trichonephila clavipes]